MSILIMTMLKNVKIYEDKVTNEKHMPEATKPEGLTPEVIREIEKKSKKVKRNSY